jgi:hypothetical protein
LIPKARYLTLLAVIQDSQQHFELDQIPLSKCNRSLRWTPKASGKLFFIANDATFFPAKIYSNNTGTLKLRVQQLQD